MNISVYMLLDPVSAHYLALYARSLYNLHYFLVINLSRWSRGGMSASGRLPRSFLYLVASLAPKSASSFPRVSA